MWKSIFWNRMSFLFFCIYTYYGYIAFNSKFGNHYMKLISINDVFHGFHITCIKYFSF